MHRVLAIAVLLLLRNRRVHGHCQQAPLPPPEFSAPAADLRNCAGTCRQGPARRGHGAVLINLSRQSPEPAGVERLRGIIFYQREQFAQAVEAFTKAVAQDPATVNRSKCTA